MSRTHVEPGLDVLLAEGHPRITGGRVGLVCNHTSVSRSLDGAANLLYASGRVDLVALFGPEHGVRGQAQAGITLGDATDEVTGLPAYSLYGERRAPTPEMLAGLDALLFDLQDVGVRYATYLSTMYHCQRAAAEAGLDFVVLDRPNPLRGDRVEGRVLDPAFASFVGVHPIPIRHGMTAGELAGLFASREGWPEPLVVGARGWRRDLWYDETDLPWVLPSPNLPTLDSVALYPGTCLVEGTNLSEGRGTTRPFELVGAPWVRPSELALELRRRGLEGIAFRPTYFTPTFSKHAGESCGGVQVHVTDRNILRPAELGIHLLHALLTLYPERFQWLGGGDGRYFVDWLLGSDAPRLALEAGAQPREVMADWERQASEFVRARQPFLLYE